MHRRQFFVTSIALLLASPFGKASGFTMGREVVPMPRQMKAGDYVSNDSSIVSPSPLVCIVRSQISNASKRLITKLLYRPSKADQ